MIAETRNLDTLSTQHALAALRQSADGIAIADLSGTITFANGAWATLHGYAAGDMAGKSLWDLHPGGQSEPALETLLDQCNTEGAASGEIEHVRKDGSTFVSWMALTQLKDESGEPTGYMSVIRDLTERKRREQKLEHRTKRDGLTNALNHGALVEEMYAFAESLQTHLSIVVVDVDGLKVTNDTYGHAMGDAVLRAVAKGLGEDELETVVGRYGGDEFVVLLPNADYRLAEAFRERMLAKFDSMTVVGLEDSVRIPVCVSMGVATYPDDADGVDAVLNLADSAMYSSRQEKPDAEEATRGRRVLDKERATRLVAEIVPLLTRSGTREEKLAMVAQHLSAGAGYDGVNFEVLGDSPEPPSWQSAHMRSVPKGIVDAWLHEESQAADHPLGRLMEETRRPLFLDDLATDERLTEKERELLSGIGFKSALVVPMIWQDRVVGMLSVGSKSEKFHNWDAQFLTAVASQVTAIVFMTTLVEELQVASDNLKAAHAETVMMLASVAEANDDTTGHHLRRVRSVSEALAKELGYTDDEADEIGLAAVLHDIGKIQVPGEILRKEGPLTDEEWVVMRKHTVWGAEYLRGHRGFALAEVVAHSHHERWDGGGYPRGLQGEDIAEAAQITTVADTFDAITNDRPYRRGRSMEEAVEEIMSCVGTQFSPRVTEALKRLYDRGALLPEEQSGQRAA